MYVCKIKIFFHEVKELQAPSYGMFASYKYFFMHEVKELQAPS
jgi:hypothetical protein